jgi:glutamyl-tRNA reductase
VLTAMRARMDEVRAKELADALRHLPRLSEADRAVVEELSKSLMNKFLHEPTVRLRAAASNGRGLGVVDTVRYLFGLERKAKPGDEKPLADTRRRS